MAAKALYILYVTVIILLILSYSYWYILRFPDARTATNRLALFFYPWLDSCGLILHYERSAHAAHTVPGFPSCTDCIHRSWWEIRNPALPQRTTDYPEGITEEMPAVMRRQPGNSTTAQRCTGRCAFKPDALALRQKLSESGLGERVKTSRKTTNAQAVRDATAFRRIV